MPSAHKTHMSIDIANQPEVCLIGKNDISIVETSVDHFAPDIGELQPLSIASGLQVWSYSVLDIVSIFGLIMGFKCDSDFPLYTGGIIFKNTGGITGGHKRF